MQTVGYQFNGFFQTPVLWKGTNSFGLKQFELEPIATPEFEGVLPGYQRLGKRVESFVSFELKHYKNIEILVENLQIQHDKITLGELDCILSRNGKLEHLEIVYKFYLYETSVGKSPLEHWIGPNRKDSLVEKLVKLKEKQLPLLNKSETQSQLQALGITNSGIKQYVYFKAQLFVPYQSAFMDLGELNSSCIAGFYIPFKDFVQFNTCKFYMPVKLNWLQEIRIQVNWLSYAELVNLIEPLMLKEISPLIWIKFPNGETSKCFVVWWT